MSLLDIDSDAFISSAILSVTSENGIIVQENFNTSNVRTQPRLANSSNFNNRRLNLGFEDI